MSAINTSMEIVEPDSANFSGAERAAILLLSLGEQCATEVIRHMTSSEVEKIGRAMTAIHKVGKESLCAVLEDFREDLSEKNELPAADREYLQMLFSKAFGDEKAGNMLDRIEHGRTLAGLESLKWIQPRAVAELLSHEHPQLIAIVLSYLEQEQAAEVLAALPESLRVDIVMRVATLDGIRPGALTELNEVIEEHLATNADHIKSYAYGGFRAAAGMMNHLDARLEAEIVAKIRAIDEQLGVGIQDLKFEFSNLGDLDDRTVQALLREISSETLRIALRGADHEIRENIFKNMSRRASDMLREDLDSLGPVRLSEVRTAQREILSIVWQMVENGEISLDGKGDEYI